VESFDNLELGSEKMFFEYNVRAYADFLDGQDDFTFIERELEQMFGEQSSLSC
jgi:SMC interacting uncharacterized protein involved in chromosome segregation